MPLHDLTPQLRTRLSRVERAVGWFITIAVIALIAALGYYIYNRAQAKGWFVTKVSYQTSLNDATGLKVGDPVKLMGFNVGEITDITPNDPAQYFGVTITFDVRAHYYGYIWMDSKARVAPSDFLGGRSIEILKGHRMQATVHELPDKSVVVLNTDLARNKFKELRDAISMQLTTNTFHALRQTNAPLQLLHQISQNASNQ
jgi:ABC-type transporter Mla subunit MlaD